MCFHFYLLQAKLSSLIERLHVTPKLDTITKAAHERGLGDGLDVESDDDLELDYRGSLASRRRLSDGNMLMQSASPQVCLSLHSSPHSS